MTSIVKDFESLCVGELCINRRDDGYYYIMDGQHRYIAMKKLGYPSVACTVYNGLTAEQEAKMFFILNQKASVKTYEKTKAKLAYGDEETVQLNEIIRSHGLELGFSREKESAGIVSHKTLSQINKNYGKEHLDEVLKIIIECFGTQKKNFQGRFIDGVSRFWNKYSKDIKRIDFVRKMKNESSFVNVSIKAREFQSVKKCSFADGVSEALKFFYNKSRQHRIE